MHVQDESNDKPHHQVLMYYIVFIKYRMRSSCATNNVSTSRCISQDKSQDKPHEVLMYYIVCFKYLMRSWLCMYHASTSWYLSVWYVWRLMSLGFDCAYYIEVPHGAFILCISDVWCLRCGIMKSWHCIVPHFWSMNLCRRTFWGIVCMLKFEFFFQTRKTNVT